MEFEETILAAGFHLHCKYGEKHVYINDDANLVLEYDSASKEVYLSQFFRGSFILDPCFSPVEVEI